jgi:hypothetical protein
VVNQVRDDFLPRAGFAGDQDAAVALGDDAHEVEHGAHPGAPADHHALGREAAGAGAGHPRGTGADEFWFASQT